MFGRQFFICAVLCLLTTQALAQNFPPLPTSQRSTTFFGVKTGYVNSSLPFGAALHFGVQNASGFALRISGSLQPRDSGTIWGLEGDGYSPFTNSDGLSVYGGAGAKIFFKGTSFLADAHGLLGSEYRLGRANLAQLGLFLELHIGASLSIGELAQPPIPSFSTLFGLNIYF